MLGLYNLCYLVSSLPVVHLMHSTSWRGIDGLHERSTGLVRGSCTFRLIDNRSISAWRRGWFFTSTAELVTKSLSSTAGGQQARRRGNVPWCLSLETEPWKSSIFVKNDQWSLSTKDGRSHLWRSGAPRPAFRILPIHAFHFQWALVISGPHAIGQKPSHWIASSSH